MITQVKTDNRSPVRHHLLAQEEKYKCYIMIPRDITTLNTSSYMNGQQKVYYQYSGPLDFAIAIDYKWDWCKSHFHRNGWYIGSIKLNSHDFKRISLEVVRNIIDIILCENKDIIDKNNCITVSGETLAQMKARVIQKIFEIKKIIESNNCETMVNFNDHKGVNIMSKLDQINNS